MRGVIAFGIAALLAAPALAQPRGGFFFGPGRLLSNKSVQEELKLDKNQAEKAAAAAQKTREDMQDDLGKLREASPEERVEILKKFNDATYKSLGGILKPDQIKRLKQIELQVQSARIFLNPDIQKALNLTEDQKEDLKKTNDETMQKAREMFQDAQGDQEKFRDAMTKVNAMNKENMAKITKSLKPEQQKKLHEMLGKPFELKIEPPRGN